MLNWVFVTCIILLASHVNAQANSPFDTLSVARGMDRLSSISTDMTHLNNPSACRKFNSNDPVSAVSCPAKPEDFDNSITSVIEFEKGQLDPRLYDVIPVEMREQSKKQKIACVIRAKTQNDNKEFFGLCGTKENRAAECGDDVGRTFALGFGISCTTEDGLSKSFDYSTELYSKPELQNGQFVDVVGSDGQIRRKQKAVSESIFQLMEDNIAKGKLTYWKRGVGLINITDKKKAAAKVQDWFHETVNQVQGDGTAVKYQYVDGSMDKWGAFVNFSVGLQEHMQFGSRCRVSLAGETGFRAGTIKEAALWNASGDAKLSFDVTQSTAMYLRARQEATDRIGSGMVQESTVAAGFERTRTGSFIEMGVTKQRGNRTDVPDDPNIFTGENDPMLFVRTGFGFGLRRR